MTMKTKPAFLCSRAAGERHHMSGGEHDKEKKETMAKLEGTKGAEFDRVVVAEMLKHHEMANKMTRLAKNQGDREDVRAMADKMLKTQDRES